MIEEAERELGRRGTVGVGHPGAISPATGLIKNANSTWLNGRPLDQDLRRASAARSRFANDANCLALSEATDGAGRRRRQRVRASSSAPACGGGIVVAAGC